MPDSAMMTAYRFAVLGDPVEHSRSPQLHTAMLSLAGLEGEYLKIRADGEVLDETVQDLREGLWNGLNITMPLKAAAARASDSLSPQASLSGSVNTLRASGGLILGDSTDSTAFRELMADDRFAGVETVLILGAGGSAAAALISMPGEVNVYLAARRPERATQLAARHRGEVVSWGAAVADALVVNTTPLGMKGEDLPEGLLEVASGLVDLPYARKETPAVEFAGARGMPHADGHEFLLRQAIASFELWTGVKTGIGALRAALRKV
jgi:shikimate dehydrogenase